MKQLRYKEELMKDAWNSLEQLRMDPHAWRKHGIHMALDGVKKSAGHILSFHNGISDMQTFMEVWYPHLIACVRK